MYERLSKLHVACLHSIECWNNCNESEMLYIFQLSHFSHHLSNNPCLSLYFNSFQLSTRRNLFASTFSNTNINPFLSIFNYLCLFCILVFFNKKNLVFTFTLLIYIIFSKKDFFNFLFLNIIIIIKYLHCYENETNDWCIILRRDSYNLPLNNRPWIRASIWHVLSQYL